MKPSAFAFGLMLLPGCGTPHRTPDKPALAPHHEKPLTAPSTMTTTTSEPQGPALPPIVQAGTAVLRARATEVPADTILTPAFQELVETMKATMRHAPGVGLAAPQIGVPWRVIVLEDRPELQAALSAAEKEERERTPFAVRVFVNPVLTKMGDAQPMFFEGCLSVKGYVGLVERSREVEVTGLDEHGVSQTWRVKGWPARILQHEVDHLDGTLYIDRMKTRSFTNADAAKTLYAGKPIQEIRAMLGL
jgi:peptide deformylase